jgi:CDP-glycerol glycerophosphotransferase (TagB/SpsB family)
MAKELLINGYLFFFKVVFTICKGFSLRNKVVFVCSYTDNSQFVYDEMMCRKTKTDVVFLCRGKATLAHFTKTGELAIPFETANILLMVRSAYHLATAKLVVVDNYFGFLSVSTFKKKVTCVQLWHACGAFKTFGFKDRSVAHRSVRAQVRFSTVYRHFDKIVVGSDAMEKIFMRSFGLDETHFVHLGVPRTDLFFDLTKKEQVQKSLEPLRHGKKIILYAPTFRDHPMEEDNFGLDLRIMEKELSNDYVLLLRLHPSERGKLDFNGLNPQFVIDGSGWDSVNELLLGVDLLVTDYSSIPFEYALLKRPMIFFPYDLNAYERSRGLWGDYIKTVPGPVAYSTQEVVQLIKQNVFDLNQIVAFSEKWNRYSTGKSSSQAVEYLTCCLNK